MSDFFPTMSMKPNPQCSSSHCRLRQEEYNKYLEMHPPAGNSDKEAKNDAEEVIHDSNEWGICDNG